MDDRKPGGLRPDEGGPMPGPPFRELQRDAPSFDLNQNEVERAGGFVGGPDDDDGQSGPMRRQREKLASYSPYALPHMQDPNNHGNHSNSGHFPGSSAFPLSSSSLPPLPSHAHGGLQGPPLPQVSGPMGSYLSQPGAGLGRPGPGPASFGGVGPYGDDNSVPMYSSHNSRHQPQHPNMLPFQQVSQFSQLPQVQQRPMSQPPMQRQAPLPQPTPPPMQARPLPGQSQGMGGSQMRSLPASSQPMMRIVPTPEGFELVIPPSVLRLIKNMDDNREEVTFLLSPDLMQPQGLAQAAGPLGAQPPQPSPLQMGSPPIASPPMSPGDGGDDPQGKGNARPKHYKCSKCGQPKKGHVCALGDSPTPSPKSGKKPTKAGKGGPGEGRGGPGGGGGGGEAVGYPMPQVADRGQGVGAFVGNDINSRLLQKLNENDDYGRV